MSDTFDRESTSDASDLYRKVPNVEGAYMHHHRRHMLSDEQTLYHYTTAEGLLSIIESGGLRATHFEYLSDPMEMDYGLSLAREELSRFIESSNDENRQTTPRGIELLNEVFSYLAKGSQLAISHREMYFVSFSEVGDQLSQWRAFADGGKGFSIGFTKLRGLVDTSAPEGGAINAQKVNYNKTSQLEVFYNLIRHGLSDYDNWCRTKSDSSDQPAIGDFVHGIATYIYLATRSFKAPGFSEEREWRYMVTAPLGDEDGQERKVRARQGFLVPYLEIDMRDDSTNCMPIERIFVGPRQDFKKTQRALTFHLQRHGYIEEPAKLPEILPSSCSLAF